MKNDVIRENETVEEGTAPPDYSPRRRRSSRPRRRRSFFWPIVLVGAGVLWLLVNLGTISTENLTVLIRLWPLLLILLGVDMLFGRRLPALGGLIGLLAVGAVIYLVINGPALGLTTELPQFNLEDFQSDDGVRSGTFIEPLDGAETAVEVFELGWQRANIYALDESSDNLVEADLDYAGDIQFDTGGGSERYVTINERGNLNAAGIEIDDYEWNIGINPQPEVYLTIEMGVNEGDFDLRDINLKRLEYHGGFRDVEMALPAAGDRYEASISTNFGDTVISVEDGAEIDMRLVGRAGDVSLEIGEDVDLDLELEPELSDFAITVPDDAAVRIEAAASGGGELVVPDGYERVEEADQEGFFPFADSVGVWESPEYSPGGPAIIIMIDDLGVGSLTIEN